MYLKQQQKTCIKLDALSRIIILLLFARQTVGHPPVSTHLPVATTTDDWPSYLVPYLKESDDAFGAWSGRRMGTLAYAVNQVFRQITSWKLRKPPSSSSHQISRLLLVAGQIWRRILTVAHTRTCLHDTDIHLYMVVSGCIHLTARVHYHGLAFAVSHDGLRVYAACVFLSLWQPGLASSRSKSQWHVDVVVGVARVCVCAGTSVENWMHMTHPTPYHMLGFGLFLSVAQ